MIRKRLKDNLAEKIGIGSKKKKRNKMKNKDWKLFESIKINKLMLKNRLVISGES